MALGDSCERDIQYQVVKTHMLRTPAINHNIPLHSTLKRSCLSHKAKHIQCICKGLYSLNSNTVQESKFKVSSETQDQTPSDEALCTVKKQVTYFQYSVALNTQSHFKRDQLDISEILVQCQTEISSDSETLEFYNQSPGHIML